jgi:hypothetical protein
LKNVYKLNGIFFYSDKYEDGKFASSQFHPAVASLLGIQNLQNSKDAIEQRKKKFGGNIKGKRLTVKKQSISAQPASKR